MKQLRLAGQKGYVTVPRIIHADAGICMTGGHGHQDGVEEADSRGACAPLSEDSCVRELTGSRS